NTSRFIFFFKKKKMAAGYPVDGNRSNDVAVQKRPDDECIAFPFCTSVAGRLGQWHCEGKRPTHMCDVESVRLNLLCWFCKSLKRLSSRSPLGSNPCHENRIVFQWYFIHRWRYSAATAKGIYGGFDLRATTLAADRCRRVC